MILTISYNHQVFMNLYATMQVEKLLVEDNLCTQEPPFHPPSIQQSAISNWRILLRFSVAIALAVSLSLKNSYPDPPTGDEGADLACGLTSTSSERSTGGSSREMLRFCRRENLGMGRELGGGELENAGPAHSSDREGGDVDGLMEMGRLRLPP
jgi:hypothetical protein